MSTIGDTALGPICRLASMTPTEWDLWVTSSPLAEGEESPGHQPTHVECDGHRYPWRRDNACACLCHS